MQKTKDKKNTAENIVSRSRARNKFSGTIKSKETNNRPCFSGVIKELRDIEVGYNPNFPLHDTPHLIKMPFEKALEAVVEHEITHKEDGKRRGCPNTREKDLELILTPISHTLKEKGIPNVPFGNQGHTTYTYFANLFSDLVVNSIVSDNNGSEGLFLMYDDMATYSGGFGNLFEAFIKTQAMTYAGIKGVSLVRRHFKNPEETKTAYQRFLERTKLLEIPRQKRVNQLANPENWEETSKIFAEEFSELLDLESLPALYFPLFGGNDFTYLDDESVQMKAVKESYEKEGSEFEPPPFMEDNHALISLYRRLAKDIEMKIESHSVETELPIAHVSKRTFDPSKDSIDKIRYGLGKNGKLEAQVGKYPLTTKSAYQVTAGNFPEVRVGLVDCSDSTREELSGGGKVMNPWAKKEKQWTDTSIYHQELLCLFGLYELFRKHGTLKKSNARGGVFSSETRMGKDLGESEKLALTPEFRGTKIDKDSLDDIFKGRGSLVYTLSDGYIANWPQIKDYFIEGAKKHHYVHLQYGEDTQMSKDLRGADLKVLLDDGSSSVKKIIDFTQNEIYGARAKK
jgi:hypothetical protein